MNVSFKLSEEDLQPEEYRELCVNPAAGAYASFEGWVRNHHRGKAVDKLYYEAFAPLAEKEGARILAEACEKFDLHQAHARHRVGDLEIGGMAVWVGVSSSHRAESFAACGWIMDQIKLTVPIWKKEFFADGEVQWVRCDCAGH